MTIDELNALATLTAGDEFPVWDSEESGESTKKITAQNMANSVKSLASLPNTTEMNTAIDQSTADVIRTGDVVNNLTSTATDKPLSAAQGKALNDQIATVSRIKTTTVTGTTNGAGNLLYNTFTGTRIIGAESNNSIVLYFLSGNYYYFKVLSWDDMSPRANASVTINAVYY